MDLRLLVWNMEWMNDLFGANDAPAAFKPDDAKPQHSRDGVTVKMRREHLSGVINELSPDVVVVVEGPNRDSELQLFFDTDVTGDWQVASQHSRGTQEVGIAVRTDEGKFQTPAFTQFDTQNIAAFAPFFHDSDGDGVREEHDFTRYPLYAEVQMRSGERFRLLGLHLKSKGIFTALEWSAWWQKADANRRRLLAQATQLRVEFLDAYLREDETKNVPLIVCGDINDGPGFDASERKFLGSAVERLMGTVWHPRSVLGNALFDTLPEQDKAELDFGHRDLYTARFSDPIFNFTFHNVWIDHVLYTRNHEEGWVSSAHIHHSLPSGERIWEKYPHASDHRPITVNVSL